MFIQIVQVAFGLKSQREPEQVSVVSTITPIQSLRRSHGSLNAVPYARPNTSVTSTSFPQKLKSFPQKLKLKLYDSV